ncbi:VOC family protein [Mesorhizobium sp. NPDC059025]|uniref:VOC family protein n=1 Tax=unclassified Mesorhizobium TaxID=325217 RepID=UPI0036AB6CC0
MAAVRYFVDDVDASVSFYTKHLGFALRQQFGPNMAILDRGDLTLWLAGRQASASRPMPDGIVPEPGGWNRFVLEVTNLPAFVKTLQDDGVSFRNTMVEGPGGRQILCQDPSGNVVELFEAAGN